MADLIEEGKFKILTVGPVKEGIAKSSGKPFKTFDLQFDGDENWYNCYWVRDTDPKQGEELDGRKEKDEKFGLQFKLKFGAGNKANWNPAGANAAVFQAAVAIVNGFLGLKPEHLADWEKKRLAGQTAVDQYLETVRAIASGVKSDVIKMGGSDAQVQTATHTSTAPPSDGDPGPVPPGIDNFGDTGDEEVELGPM